MHRGVTTAPADYVKGPKGQGGLLPLWKKIVTLGSTKRKSFNLYSLKTYSQEYVVSGGVEPVFRGL